jgi:hypothetical protein
MFTFRQPEWTKARALSTLAKTKSTLCSLFSLRPLCLLSLATSADVHLPPEASAVVVNSVSLQFLSYLPSNLHDAQRILQFVLLQHVSLGRLLGAGFCLSRTTQLFTITFFLISCYCSCSLHMNTSLGSLLTSAQRSTVVFMKCYWRLCGLDGTALELGIYTAL